MRLKSGLQLSYCTNIHPSDGLEQLLVNLRTIAGPLKKRLSPEAPFAVGLRLSNRESLELTLPGQVERLSEVLREEGLYVPLINGFPYGTFHGEPVKAKVFRPDWRDPERLRYTLRLAEILARLLPDSNTVGGVSTMPLAYKPDVEPDRELYTKFCQALLLAVESLAEIENRTGRRVRLELEPEPDGLLSTIDELVTFWKGWLLPQAGSREAVVRRYLAACVDCCHCSVNFEDPQHVFEVLRETGVPVGRIQVSAALEAHVPEALPDLARLDEPVYLHQVVERSEASGKLLRFADLPDALAQAPGQPSCWRIHFHVPVFMRKYGRLLSTNGETAELVRVAQSKGVAPHFEIETYTWSILPDELKVDLAQSIEREYRWVMAVLSEATCVA